jgi:multiple sugar transport system ATP-binding protein
VALRQVSLEVHDREFMVLVGPSGCGKSTILRLIAGLEELTEGEIRIDGHSVSGLPPRDRDVAMVFQSYALYPHMTVYDNIAFGLRVRRLRRPEIELRVRETAQLLQIDHLLSEMPRRLSGGERQRVALGRAIVRRPRVFLFDEPLSNLDAKLRSGMRAEIASLQRRLGVTAIYVTHDQVEAMTMGERIAVLHQGRIMQVGKPLELYQLPANRFVAGFLGSPPMNFLPVRVPADVAAIRLADQRWSIPGELRAALQPYAGQEVTLGIRPEQLDLTPEGRIPGEVVLVEPTGDECLVHVQVGGGAVVARARRGWSDLHPGQTVALGCDLAQAHFFDPATEARII